ncbi:MAG: glycoside hydrolase family 13 protein [Oscillospiraceae bacterium]|nr:glycoside hydrolase family 13 protein [Oscillospiraceae bacterium]
MVAPFDSRDEHYRSPFGAVEQGTNIHLTIRVPRDLHCSYAELAVKYDYSYNWQYHKMYWYGMHNDEYDKWECDFKPEDIGLYWYGFRLRTQYGDRYINPTDVDTKSCIAESPGRAWQITCYKKGFTTPSWPVGGVMYQIFPDRFCFSGEKKDINRNDITIMDDWYGLPQWWPNENGEITNTDFFQGDLKGITQKLSYLKKLGVTCIYLNPISKAYSNHRYDTGDYSEVDPMLGTEEDFVTLCKEASKLGIHIINDGVYSHTGSDSKYFNRSGNYGNGGAYRDKNSPYYSWYKFNEWPNNYNSWWGFYTLPEVHEEDPNFNEYINGENGIVRKWMRLGNSGWRLDVADELPDGFLENLRKAVKAENPQGLVIGEVWEDASNKESYGARRKFLLGDQLDSVMNYVFRNAILDFCRGTDAKYVMDTILSVLENYPKPVIRVLMNLLSTHDTERILTMIAGEPLNGRDRKWQAEHKLNKEQRERGLTLMRIATGIQYTLPGFPCVYYGDEAGMEGYRDPFNRCGYPWGNEDQDLIQWHTQLGEMRQTVSALWDGDFRPVYAKGNVLSYLRYDKESGIYCAFNTGDVDVIMDIPAALYDSKPLMGTEIINDRVVVPAKGTAFIAM